MTAKVASDKSVSLPGEMVDELGFEPGDELIVVHESGGPRLARRESELRERPRTEAERAAYIEEYQRRLDSVVGVFGPDPFEGLTVDEYIEEMRGR